MLMDLIKSVLIVLGVWKAAELIGQERAMQAVIATSDALMRLLLWIGNPHNIPMA